MRLIFLSLSLLFLFSSTSWAQNRPLQEFETDNCTLFANGTVQEPDLWKHCCFEHDLRYWFGGSFPERDVADLHLKQCVQKVAGKTWADLIYKGVRFGHQSPIQHRLHWGWGWAPPRGNGPLTAPEKAVIRQGLNQLSLPQDYIQEFLRKYGLN